MEKIAYNFSLSNQIRFAKPFKGYIKIEKCTHALNLNKERAS